MRPNRVTTREVARLCIVGLELAPHLVTTRPMEWTDEASEYPYLNACVGYIALAVHHLASYLDVPLRFPLRPFGSRSLVVDFAPRLSGGVSSAKSRREQGACPNPVALNDAARLYPLYLEGSEQRAFNTAIRMLNKDIQQLLTAHGLTAASSNQALQNLYKLVAAAASAMP